MLERLLHTALNEELDLLIADPAALNLFMSQLDLGTTEIQAVRTYFNRRRPMVSHNYPRISEVTFPLYAIILESDQETTSFVGDFEGIVTEERAIELDDANLWGADIIGALFTSKYQIWVCAEEHPDACLYFYQIAKYALMKRRNSLKAQGIVSMRMSGQDFKPHPDYMPSNVFTRRLNLECVYDFSIVGNQPGDGGVGGVDGIYVQDSNQPDAGVIPVVIEQDEEE